ncbi:MAG TPA: hypothetical protein ENH82_08425 [bacterium]|nr:hypothetical protein [bacterium]
MLNGKLEYIGSTSIITIESKGSRRLSIATVLPESIDIDTACKYPVDFEANAKELVRRWNGYEDGGIVDELRKACEESQKAIMLLYECNKDVEITLGSGIQLKKAEKLLEAAIEKAKP